jgi:uridine kinase
VTGHTPFLVGVAGGSGSGKSALVTRLAATLADLRVAVLCHDAYYRDRSDVPAAARATLDFDTPEALDQALFRTHLAALRDGMAIQPPRYCFITHRRIGEEPIVEPGDVVLVEGILLFCDPEIRGLLDLRLFVDVPHPVRLQRRLARDTAERGRTPESVIAQFASAVSPAHERWVAPTREVADVVLGNVESLDAPAEIAAAVIRHAMGRRAQPAALRPAAA